MPTLAHDTAADAIAATAATAGPEPTPGGGAPPRATPRAKSDDRGFFVAWAAATIAAVAAWGLALAVGAAALGLVEP